MFVAVKTKPSPRQGKGDHEVVDEDAIFKGLHPDKHQFINKNKAGFTCRKSEKAYEQFCSNAFSQVIAYKV